MEDSLGESVWQRARHDTLAAFHTVRFWLFELCTGTGLTLLVLLCIPPWAEDGRQIVYQILVPLLGIFAGFGIVFLISLVVAPYRQRNEARTKVAEYEAVPLDIFYDDNCKTCKRDLPGERIWRVEVTGSKGLCLENVIVNLIATDPPIPDLPQALHPMSVKPSNGGWEGDGSFSIRPDATEHVDALRYRPESGGKLFIVFQPSQSVGRLIPYDSYKFTSYKFTLKAQGKVGQPVTKHFRFEASEDGQKRFYEWKKATLDTEDFLNE